jgi:hypothetical protein
MKILYIITDCNTISHYEIQHHIEYTEKCSIYTKEKETHDKTISH